MAARRKMPDDDPSAALEALLSEYTDEIRALAHDVMAFVDARLPGATRMVYGNFNATVIGYSPDGAARHAVCSVAAYARWVNLFFFVGPDLPDPHGLLQGTGTTVRSVRISKPSDLDERVAALLAAAIEMWQWEFDPQLPTTTVVVSVSDKRRARR